jgi:hypothetical protein
LNFSASGAGEYGNLHAGVSTNLSIAGTTPTSAFVDAESLFEDIITVNYLPLTGQQGTMFFGYSLDGTVAGTGQDNAFAIVNVSVGPTLSQHSTATYTADTNGIFVTTSFNFTYGQPFGIAFSLFADSGTLSPLTMSGVGGSLIRNYTNASGSASALFANTLTLSSITVEDPSGVVVTGEQFSSASGSEYTEQGVVPEPSTWILLATAFPFCFFLRRRKAAVS